MIEIYLHMMRQDITDIRRRRDPGWEAAAQKGERQLRAVLLMEHWNDPHAWYVAGVPYPEAPKRKELL